MNINFLYLIIYYSLRSEISISDFVLTYYKVYTKTPTLISDRREYNIVAYKDICV
jgi:hypothetical protein